MEEPLGEHEDISEDRGEVGRDPVAKKGRLLEKNQNKTKVKRGGKGKNKDNRGKFVIYGTNAAGLASKLDSLKNVCKTIQPKVFMVQETKLSKHKELKINNCEILKGNAMIKVVA